MYGPNVLFGAYSPLARGYAGIADPADPTRKFIWYTRGPEWALKYVPDGVDFKPGDEFSRIAGPNLENFTLSDHYRNAINMATYRDHTICIVPLKDITGEGEVAVPNSAIKVGAKMSKVVYTHSKGHIAYFYGGEEIHFRKRKKKCLVVIPITSEKKDSGIIVHNESFISAVVK